MLSAEDHIEYFSKSLIPEIKKKLQGKQLKNYELKPVNQLNGFMSSIYKGELTVEEISGGFVLIRLLKKKLYYLFIILETWRSSS